jgi:hypothetical protein
MVQLDKDLLTWLKEKFYIKTEIESLLSHKSDTNHTHPTDNTLSTTSVNPVANKVITNELNNKAGKNHASTTTDYGEATSTKYGHVKVDTELSTTSTSPVQNRKIKEALDSKAASNHNHNSLSSTIISSNQDLNNYKNPGEYYCDSNNVAASLSNCPVNIAFHLSVVLHAGVRQILKTYASTNVRTYERNYYSNTWGNWYLTYTTETLTTENGLISSDEKTKLSQLEPQATRNIIDSSLSTSSNNAIANKAVTNSLNSKAPSNHASTGNTYGLGSTSNHGHVKTINGLTQSSHVDGTALSAYQGKILKDLVDTKAASTHTHNGSQLKLGSSGSDANVSIQDAVNAKPNLGTSATTAAKGDHTHGNINNNGSIGSTANKPLITGTNGVVTTGSFGTTSGTFCQGDDSRLSNSRTPTSHTHGNLQNNGQVGSTAQSNKNVVTDGNGKITTENKIPSPTTTTLSFINPSMMSGTVRVTEKNGWATVYYENVKCTVTHNDYTQFCALPHNIGSERIFAEMNFSNINNAIIFRVNGGYLEGRCIKANQAEYGNITYPLAGNN